MRDPVRSYREAAVRGASPIGLIVILYDEIVRSIRKASDALDRGDIEARGKTLTHAVEVIGYLQSILDFEKGGQAARNLANFYNFIRMKLLEAHIKPSREGLDMMAAEFSRLASAWRQVEQAQSTGGAANAPSVTTAEQNVSTTAQNSEEHLVAMGW